ncbi:hypothetical protein [Streptomyces cylindrosporus]|uniref:Uncharacterized protein n=1 Tax=Streptomyces cylindrosporus TaxID=2927583 RepID=A0ABS9YK70_9ACTN|nr:hypothetical protein [Streptomyces cylindrosporus]MCI3277594.1 hypothetical protein [Streptomyces cylindrosporus]
MADTIRAPWTSEQVDALNAFQERGGMHPFTCGGEHTPGSPVLVAREDGWHCSDPYDEGCGFTQDWAHAFMANPDEWPTPFTGRALTDEEMTALRTANLPAGTRITRAVVDEAVRQAAAAEGRTEQAETGHGEQQPAAPAVEAEQHEYVAAVECAIGLTIDCGGTPGVHRVRDAVLAVRDPEMDRLRSEVQRLGDWCRAVSDRAATAEADRDRYHDELAVNEADRIATLNRANQYDRLLAEAHQVISVQKDLIGAERRIVATALEHRENERVKANECGDCGRDHMAELDKEIAAADQAYGQLFPPTTDGPARRPGQLPDTAERTPRQRAYKAVSTYLESLGDRLPTTKAARTAQVWLVANAVLEAAAPSRLRDEDEADDSRPQGTALVHLAAEPQVNEADSAGEDQPAPDACRPVEVGGETIRVRGGGELTKEGQAALAEVVRAGKRRMAEEALTTDKSVLRRHIAEALYAADHPEGRGFRALEQDVKERYGKRADAVLAVVLPHGKILGSLLRDSEAQLAETRAVLEEVLRHFVHKGHPGESCLSSGWIRLNTVERWRTFLHPKEPTR